ncbi:hypothetical protein FWD20_01635 [Candidatus Saccharibacteria bacterium]|nr:hypothetical protein [Candidatus Saccharibacteria bacterium]
MKWFAITGSWRSQTAELKEDLKKAIDEIIKNGDGIVSGGALGVDYLATAEMLQIPDWQKRVRIIIPTPLDVWRKHYLKRANEGVITQAQAESVNELLEKIKRGGCLIEMNFDVLNQETYFARNTEIVEMADELLAFQVNDSAGVQDAIDKAIKLNKKVTLKKYFKEEAK